MLAVISPAKKMAHIKPVLSSEYTQNEFLSQSDYLISVLKQLSPADISGLMDISADLGQLNYERFQTWTSEINRENGSPAVYAFQGDVYQGLDIESLSQDSVIYAQSHLRILSGLYGVLRPLDLILPYRLEMGTKLTTEFGKNLYEFWGNRITQNLNQVLEIQKDNILINLASEEYFKSVNIQNLKADIVTPVFKDFKDGTYKIISFYAKKARGLMVRYILEQKPENPEDLVGFCSDGYSFNANLSKAKLLVFTRN